MRAEFASWEEEHTKRNMAANKAPDPISRASRGDSRGHRDAETTSPGPGRCGAAARSSSPRRPARQSARRGKRWLQSRGRWGTGVPPGCRPRTTQRGQGTRTLGGTDGDPQQEPRHALQGGQVTLTVARTREHPLSVGHRASTASLCPCSGLPGVDRILPAAWEHPLAQAPCAFAGLLSALGPPLCGADTGPRGPWPPLLILGGRFLPEKQELSGFRGGRTLIAALHRLVGAIAAAAFPSPGSSPGGPPTCWLEERSKEGRMERPQPQTPQRGRPQRGCGPRQSCCPAAGSARTPATRHTSPWSMRLRRPCACHSGQRACDHLA